MRRISAKEAREYIPLKENYSDKSLEAAEYFTLTPSKSKEGWENVTYYTARKRSLYAKRGKGDQWVYILENETLPGLLKIGYTKTHNTPPCPSRRRRGRRFLRLASNARAARS